ncbi:MAG: hypothetical protein BJ554DRAFT_3370, partial [Olpidium bornovanus]
LEQKIKTSAEVYPKDTSLGEAVPAWIAFNRQVDWEEAEGVLICRHRIPLPDSKTRQHYTVTNFNVGREVTFYCRTFLITGCDVFTRNFLSKIGVW